MWLGVVAGWLLGRAQATDVLVPEATPATLDDFAVAYMIYDMIATNLADDGLAVDDAEAIRVWAKTDGDACFDNAACPANLWGRTGARLAVVLSVSQGSGALAVEALLYTRGQSAPVRVVKEQVPEGSEDAFAREMVGVVRTELDAVGDPEEDPGPVELPPEESVSSVPSTHTSTGKATSDKAGSVKATSDKAAADRAAAEKKAAEKAAADQKTADKKAADKKAADKAAADKRSSASTQADANADEARRSTSATGALTTKQESERRTMGIPVAAYRRYLASGQKRDAWLADARVWTNHAHLGVGAGVGLGDVDRGYAVWVHLAEQDQALVVDGSSYWAGDGAGTGVYLGAEVGYAPLWFLDLDLGLGVQQGMKHLDAGWECPDCQASDQVVPLSYAAVPSAQLVAEPKARFLFRAAGTVKPYASVGAQLRVYDGFTIPDDAVSFPVEPGGIGLGAGAGVGVALDLAPHVSVLIDVPWTFTLAPGADSADAENVQTSPRQLGSWGGVLRPTVQGTYRF